MNLDHGTSGTVDSYYFGPYVTWLDAAAGYYFDGGLKFNHFRNESKVGMSDGSRAKGDYDNSGVGGWAEFGRHIKFGNDYFIEPFTRFSAVVIQGKHYNLDNGMDADGDRARSLLGKVGSTFGRNFDVGNGKAIQPYVSAAMGYEFAKNNEVQVNNNVLNNDLSGARAEFGTGWRWPSPRSCRRMSISITKRASTLKNRGGLILGCDIAGKYRRLKNKTPLLYWGSGIFLLLE